MAGVAPARLEWGHDTIEVRPVSGLRAATLLLATVATGLMAGLFAAFAYAVLPGLARVDDRAFVAAMRAVNQAILNGWFALCFGGALVCTLAAVLLHLPAASRTPLPWLVAALVLYGLVLAVTVAVNVPLNDRLDAGAAAGVDPARLRAAFEGGWVRWNVARAVLNTAALGCLGWASLVARAPGG
ncbi:anthrone oxygenase family protein [Micromonospora auratinigra]|uniref:Uncharacterized membrane protein n=1 Tax=Micromonospora auratinigra TaxID=261654 RepID=A0A1A8ZD65_9ACTN|nr:anthrone oxygenase family protein [Micromonospora auratinigra]SBT41830.1 Uncharacterized membrane protein [Micromonospora auratinigra]